MLDVNTPIWFVFITGHSNIRLGTAKCSIAEVREAFPCCSIVLGDTLDRGMVTLDRGMVTVIGRPRKG